MSTQLSFIDAVAERDRILAAFASNHRTYLEALRGFARDLARRNGTVTVDDVREEMRRRDFPFPNDIGADERVLGALFKSRDFVAIAQQRTTREAWAARVGVARSAVTVYEVRP